MSDIKRIGVVGAGTMGHGIAQVFAQAGFEVLLADQTAELAENGITKIKSVLERRVEQGKLTASEAQAILNRVTPTDDLKLLKQVELVIEAIVESLDEKGKLFRILDQICPPRTIFATNTSSLSITKLAFFTERPAQFIGMHFMNPPPIMKLVEVIHGKQTRDRTVQTIFALCEKVGKIPVEANDSPGFIANRILMPMINEAIFAYQEGVGTRKAIDTVMKIGMNHPMGPLELADFIGLDVCLAILEVLEEGFGDPKYHACPLLREMVAAGKLGRKTKKGFYDYN